MTFYPFYPEVSLALAECPACKGGAVVSVGGAHVPCGACRGSGSVVVVKGGAA